MRSARRTTSRRFWSRATPTLGSGPTPEEPAGVPPGRITWGYGRTAMSRRAPISRSSRGIFAARVSRTSGRPRSSSPAFAAAASLGGRCGACEMNAQCGGCRARAYGMTGDLMAEDPLCTHIPGKFAGSPLLAQSPPLPGLGDGGPQGPPSATRSVPRSNTGWIRRRRSRGTMRLPNA